VLPFGPTEAVGKQFQPFADQLSMVGVTVILFSEQTCESSSKILHVFISGTPYSLVAHVAARHFLILSGALLGSSIHD
jgi:hypothetical protein